MSTDRPPQIPRGSGKAKKVAKTTRGSPQAATPLTNPLLEKIKKNPKNDWGIKDVEKLCEQTGVTCTPPGSGSHYKLSSPYCDWIQTIPAHRPIKTPYIKYLIKFVEQHLRASVMESKNG